MRLRDLQHIIGSDGIPFELHSVFEEVFPRALSQIFDVHIHTRRIFFIGVIFSLFRVLKDSSLRLHNTFQCLSVLNQILFIAELVQKLL